MGREIRRVPEGWEHPRQDCTHSPWKGGCDGARKNGGRCYVPMHKHFNYTEGEIQEGLRDGWLTDDPPFYGVPVVPQWPDAERTHYQMYETVSEGTPVTPVFATKAELVDYLVQHGDRWDQRRAEEKGLTAEGWPRANAEAFVEREFAPSAILVGGVIQTPRDMT